MNNIQIDDETLQIFLEEAREHLSDIESELVAIESDGTKPMDSELVNKVFRGIHSIKGGAGFFGLETLKTLAHTLENVLNRIRNSELIPRRNVVNAMLKAADVLNGMIADPVNSNEVDITEPMNGLKNVDAPTEDAPAAANHEIKSHDGNVIFSLPENDLVHACKGGKFLYLMECDFNIDVAGKKRDLAQFIGELQKTGIIVTSSPALDTDGSLKVDASSPVFYILYATVLEEELMRDFAEFPSERLSLVKIEKKPASIAPAAASGTGSTSAAKTSAPAAAAHKATAPAKAPAAPAKSPTAPVKVPTTQTSNFLRVNVKVLDTLMSLASELVLSRNQLVQKVAKNDTAEIHSSSQSLSLIISELQEAVMSTRMQPLSNVFGKFHRIVHDLAQELDKNIRLEIEGEDVELDKTVVESISDPLTHLIRNSVDHGVESKDDRRQAGKPEEAVVKLAAYREAGKVVIEVSDDGHGIDVEAVRSKALEKGLYSQAQLSSMSDEEIVKLIFEAGFSTAKQVTDLSGRGVGMDVVRTNINKLGGSVDIITHLGQGTTFRIKLPLTLAIIPSLLISVNRESYAIPQSNLVELVRISAADVRNRIERIGDALVMRLRGQLLPLVRLTEVLGIQSTFTDPGTGKEVPDRRQRVEDRRTPTIADDSAQERRSEVKDRRFHSQSAISIAVLAAGDFQYGLIIDKLQESEEIVVKPLGHHLGKCECYAGATILGDGKVALILDVVGIMRYMKLSEVKSKSNLEKLEAERSANRLARGDIQSFLLFRSAANEQFAVPLSLVSRIELIEANRIENNGGKRSIQYRGGSLPILTLDQVAQVAPVASQESYFVIVFAVNGKEIGLLVSQIVDTQEAGGNFDEVTFRQPGVLGSAIMSKATTLLIDLYEVVKVAAPELIIERRHKMDHKIRLLIADDSPFYLCQITKFASEAGYETLSAHDGKEAFDLLSSDSGTIDAVLTDVEMPNMDGLEFTRKVREDGRWNDLPIIAITSLSGEDAVRKGMEAGVNRYIVKLDREKIIQAVEDVLVAKGK